MQAIKKIIPKVDFKNFNIPDSFGEKAEIIILPYIETKEVSSGYDINDEIFTVNDSEKEYQLVGISELFNTNDDKNINWEDYFGIN